MEITNGPQDHEGRFHTRTVAAVAAVAATATATATTVFFSNRRHMRVGMCEQGIHFGLKNQARRAEK
jgi:hypothetical protein